MKLHKGLFFVRHAQSIGNTLTADERSALEIPNHAYELTEIGRQQSTIVGDYLLQRYGGHHFTDFLHSNFRRTRETLDIILSRLGQDDAMPVCDARLDEKWDGIFHEMSKLEIEQRYPDQIRLRKRSGYYHYRAPGGESCPDVEMRIRSFLMERLCSTVPGNCLIVGHGRWFIILQKLLHSMSVQQFLELKSREGCRNCSVTAYVADVEINTFPISLTPWKGLIKEVQTENA